MDFINELTNAVSGAVSLLTAHVNKALGGNEIATGLVVTAVLGSLVYSARRLPRRTWQFIVSKICFTYSLRYSCDDSSTIHTSEQNLANSILKHAYDNSIFVRRSGRLKIKRWVLSTVSTSGNFLFRTPAGVVRIVYREEFPGTVASKGYESSSQSVINVNISITCMMWQRDSLYKWISSVSDAKYERCAFTMTDVPGNRDLVKTRKLHIPSFYGFDEKVKQEIDKIVDDFIANRQWYIDNDIPYRLSFMLHGMPGTGKTTVAEYIAMKFNTSILYAQGNIKSMHQFITRMRLKVPDNALPLILFDDIDAYFTQLSRADKVRASAGEDAADKAVAFLLSLLDSTISPDNCVIVMTTNHIERLDPAMLRPGRFSKTLEIGYMQDATIRSIFSKSYAAPMDCSHVFTHVRACDVGDAYKQNVKDPLGFIEQVIAADTANKQKEQEHELSQTAS